MPTLGPTSFASVVSQVTGANHARSRLLSPASSVSGAETEEDADLRPSLLRSHSAASSSTTTARHTHTCESCSELEIDFAAAVQFVESYQGPHRILTQENSSPKKDFYAFYQQATVGPCLSATPAPGLSKLELSKWEKWRNLGQMTRQEAMKRYTTALDNLVDDWRRSASLRGVGSTSVPEGTTSAGQHFRKSTSMFERLPRIYDEFGELQDRVEEVSKKQDEMEAHLLNFTRENRAMFTHAIQQVDQMRTNLTALIKTLEDDVLHHYNELQQVERRQKEMATLVENSFLLAVEKRGRQILQAVHSWVRNKTFQRVLFFLFLFRVWNFVRRRRLPQLLARLLIRWLAALSSLEATEAQPRYLMRN